MIDHGEGGHGFVDLVVGIDGSVEAIDALRAAIELHGGNVGRLVLASVVPFDAEDDDRSRLLSAAAAAAAPLVATTVELRGDPATALQAYAVDAELDVIVVGTRGRGRSTSPLGSVALRLASWSPLPVLLGPAR